MTMSAHEITAKVQQYETFLNDTLRGDLNKVGRLQEQLLQQLTGYRDVKMFIKSVQENKFGLEERPLKTKVDLGCNFYVNAEILPTDRIVLSVGLNFYMEFRLDEALRFIEKKEHLLISENEQLVQKSCKIKANIKLVLDALRELQGISTSDPKPRNNIDL